MPQPQDLPAFHLHIDNHPGVVWENGVEVLLYLLDHPDLQHQLLKQLIASRSTNYPLRYITHPLLHHYMKLFKVVDEETFQKRICKGIRVELNHL